MDQELAAMTAAYDELAALDAASRRRALRWLVSVLEADDLGGFGGEAALAEAQAAGLVEDVTPV